MKIFVRIIELYKFEVVGMVNSNLLSTYKFQSYGEIESTRLFEFDGENANG